MAWRHEDGRTNHRNVTRLFEGQVIIDVLAITGGGACLFPVVETSPDTERWPDLIQGRPITETGISQIACQNLGAFLRVSYRLQGSMQFSIEWFGKSFVMGSGRPVDVLTRR